MLTHQINSYNKTVTSRETVRKGASLAARQTEPADVDVLNIAASAPIFKKKKKRFVICAQSHMTKPLLIKKLLFFVVYLMQCQVLYLLLIYQRINEVMVMRTTSGF
jgi:hypothetical protein